VLWDALVPEFGGLAPEMSPLPTIPLVPTVVTVRTQYLVDILAHHGNHVMLIGDRGSAKSLVIRHYLSQNSTDTHMSKTVVFSSATTSTSLQVTYERSPSLPESVARHVVTGACGAGAPKFVLCSPPPKKCGWLMAM